MKRIKSSKGDIPVNWGMNAIAIYSEMRNVKMDDVFNLDYSKMNLMDFFALLYSGVVDGARKAKEDCKFESIEDFNDFLEEEAGFLAELKDVFAEQQGAGKETEGGEVKKN